MSKKSKKKLLKRSDNSSGGGWEVVYSGFVLIMLCFFVMLSSFATMEEAKVMRFVRSFAAAVSVFPGGRKFDSGLVVLPESADMVDDSSELAKIFEELKVMTEAYHLGNEVALSYTPDTRNVRFYNGLTYADGSPLTVKLESVVGNITWEAVSGHFSLCQTITQDMSGFKIYYNGEYAGFFDDYVPLTLCPIDITLYILEEDEKVVMQYACDNECDTWSNYSDGYSDSTYNEYSEYLDYSDSYYNDSFYSDYWMNSW